MRGAVLSLLLVIGDVVLVWSIALNPYYRRVDVSGKHEFTPPGPDDKRGPCPAINALANHNYIPHNGIATVPEFVEGITTALGMGPDVALGLALLGVTMSGNLVATSIGGPSPLVIAIPPLGQPQGLSRSHNKFEADSSPTRGDLYMYGQAADVQMPQFMELYNSVGGCGPLDCIDKINKFHVSRVEQSKRENPNFFLGPAQGPLISGAYFFIYRIFGNKTAEHPQGILDKETLKSFFAITGPENNLTYNPGWERIPDNWNKYAPGLEYGAVGLVADLVPTLIKYPTLLAFGGNLGKVNTFTGVNAADLTGGIYNAKNLLEGNNAACFAIQAVQSLTPDILYDVFEFDYDKSPTKSLVGQLTALIGCPEMPYYNTSAFSQFPGYTDLKPDRTY